MHALKRRMYKMPTRHSLFVKPPVKHWMTTRVTTKTCTTQEPARPLALMFKLSCAAPETHGRPSRAGSKGQPFKITGFAPEPCCAQLRMRVTENTACPMRIASLDVNAWRD